MTDGRRLRKEISADALHLHRWKIAQQAAKLRLGLRLLAGFDNDLDFQAALVGLVPHDQPGAAFADAEQQHGAAPGAHAEIGYGRIGYRDVADGKAGFEHGLIDRSCPIPLRVRVCGGVRGVAEGARLSFGLSPATPQLALWGVCGSLPCSASRQTINHSHQPHLEGRALLHSPRSRTMSQPDRSRGCSASDVPG